MSKEKIDLFLESIEMNEGKLEDSRESKFKIKFLADKYKFTYIDVETSYGDNFIMLTKPKEDYSLIINFEKGTITTRQNSAVSPAFELLKVGKSGSLRDNFKNKEDAVNMVKELLVGWKDINFSYAKQTDI